MTSAMILSAVLSNIIVAAIIAGLALVVGRYCKKPALLHAIWLIVLIKLVTPPVIQLPIYSIDGFQPSSTAQVTNQPRIDVPADDSSHRDRFEFQLSIPELYFHPAQQSLAERSDFPQIADGSDEPMRDNDETVLYSQEFSEFNDEQLGFGAGTPQISDGHFEVHSTLLSESRPTTTAAGPPSKTSILAYLPTVLCLVWIALSVVWVVNFVRRQRKFYQTIRLASGTKNDDQQPIQARLDQVADRFGIKQKPRLIVAPGRFVPLVWATPLSKTLVLPRKLIKRIAPAQLDSLIAHEIAHLYCRHHYVRWFEIVVTMLFWWCPVLWMARKKLRETEEEICDACVVDTMPDYAEDYAKTLLDTADYLSQFPLTPSTPIPSTAMGMNHFEFLKRRITMIMHGQTKPRLSLTGWLVLIAILSFGLPLSPTLATASTAPGVQKRDNDKKQKQDRDDDRNEEIQEEVEEIVEELAEEIGELDEHLQEMIEDVREHLEEHLDEIPPQVKKAIAKIDVEKIIGESTKDIPKIAKMFVDEVKIDKIIGDVADAIDESEIKGELNKQELDKLKTDVKVQIKNNVKKIADALQKDMGKVKIELKDQFDQLPGELKQALKKIDIDLNFADGKSDIAKQFLKDLKIEQVIKSAINQEKEEKKRRVIRREKVESDRFQERRRDRERDDDRWRERREREQSDRFQERRRREQDQERRGRDRERDQSRDRGDLQEQLKQALQQVAKERDRANQMMKDLQAALRASKQKEATLRKQLSQIQFELKRVQVNRDKREADIVRERTERMKREQDSRSRDRERVQRERQRAQDDFSKAMRERTERKKVEDRRRSSRSNDETIKREVDRMQRLERNMQNMMRQMQQMQKQMQEMSQKNRRDRSDRR